MITCVGGKDKVLISPILAWTSENVWEFLNKLGVPHCELYDQGQERIGCLFCPMSKVREMQMFPEKFPHQTKKLKDKKPILFCLMKFIKLGRGSLILGYLFMNLKGLIYGRNKEVL